MRFSRQVRLLLAAGLIGVLTFMSSSAIARPAEFRRLDGAGLSSRQIDRTVTGLMRAAHVPGLGLALINDGRTIYVKGYGYRDVARKLPLTSDTVVAAASLTKPVFAYLVMQLADEGVIDLDAPIERYLSRPLPDLPEYADLAGDERWRKFTPRILLSHTSGLPNWRRFNDGKLEIKFDPGTRFAYSGEGIDLLQLIVEKVTGKGLAELMRARVFDPLGMSHTSMLWRRDFAANASFRYDQSGRQLPIDKRSEADAAGGMATTAADYSLFLAAFLKGRDISRSGRAEMVRPQIAIHSRQEFPSLSEAMTVDNDKILLSYGLGWGLYRSPEFGWAYFKEGNDDGVNNYTLNFPRQGTALLVLTNSSNGHKLFKYLADRLLGKTCLPWFWEGYIPYDRPDLVGESEMHRPHPPCGAVQ
jgi:CubicO group peptidase (beta-lactamase class C family)